MGTSPSGLQSPPSSGAPDAPYSPAQMAGGPPSPPPQSGSGADTGNSGLGALVNIFTDINSQLVAVSKQFPFVAKDIRQAGDMLRSVLKQIMSNPGMSEPPAPQGMA